MKVAYEQAQNHRASFIICDYLTKEKAQCANWPNAFTTIKIPGPGTCLAIMWSNFDSYLRCLSKSVRKDYRRNRNRAVDLGIEAKYHPITQPLGKDTLDQAIQLIRNVEARHGSAPHPWTRAMLKNAHMVDASWVTAKIGDQLASCGLVIGDGNIREMKLLGLDYNIRYAYFQVIYTAVRCAIEQKVQAIWGGSGAYELKHRMGFQVLDNNYIAFGSQRPIFKRLGQWAAKIEQASGKQPKN
jgi:predicted N-acyltransferase